MKRYIVQHNGLAGTYYEQFGWQVIDTQPHSVEFRVVMSGGKREAQRWARELNARIVCTVCGENPCNQGQQHYQSPRSGSPR